MLTVKEKYVCGREDKTNKKCHVYYLCQCDCGKEVIFSGDEIAKHPYSCGCTKDPNDLPYKQVALDERLSQTCLPLVINRHGYLSLASYSSFFSIFLFVQTSSKQYFYIEISPKSEIYDNE